MEKLIFTYRLSFDICHIIVKYVFIDSEDRIVSSCFDMDYDRDFPISQGDILEEIKNREDLEFHNLRVIVL